MNFVIPMAGLGERFATAGYDLPKWLLPAHGRTAMEWAVSSLPLHLCSQLIFIALRHHDERHGLKKHVERVYEGLRPILVLLDRPTGGQAETVMQAHHLIDPKTPLLIFNIDTYFKSTSLSSTLLRTDVDGVLGAFRSDQPRFSYARVNEKGLVLETAEKDVISPYALSGMYHFRFAADFFSAAEGALRSRATFKGEYYVAPLYNELIKRGKRFVLDLCSEIRIFGTPAEYEAFLVAPAPQDSLRAS